MKSEIEKRGTVYVGKSIHINNQFMQENADKIVELAKRISKNFAYKYRLQDISELESQAVEIIISKCGDIVYNYSNNMEVTMRCIYKKVFNYLKINLDGKEILTDYALISRSKKHNVSEKGYENEEIDVGKWDLNEEQETILRYISQYIEQGYKLGEVIEIIGDKVGLDSESLLEQVEEIKGCMLQKMKDVREGEDIEL